METKFFLAVGVLSGFVAIVVAVYLRWSVRKLTGYRPDYFICYWLALIGCLVNLFLPFVYPILMAPYRKLSPWVEASVLNVIGFIVCLLLYWLGIRNTGKPVLALSKAILVTAGQYTVFLVLGLLAK